MRDPLRTLPGRLTTTGWTPPPDMTEQQWLAAGRALSQVERGVGWWIGDLWNAGEPYGNRVAALKELGIDHGHARNCGSVAARVSRRHDTLSFTHHALVASLQPHEQERWLKKAERARWTVAQLRKELPQPGTRRSATHNFARAIMAATAVLAELPAPDQVKDLFVDPTSLAQLRDYLGQVLAAKEHAAENSRANLTALSRDLVDAA
jgi:hypothetical protein